MLSASRTRNSLAVTGERLDRGMSLQRVEQLLRTVKHPAHPHDGLCPFDDLLVSTIARLYVKHQMLYDGNPKLFSKSLFTRVVDPLQRGRFSY